MSGEIPHFKHAKLAFPRLFIKFEPAQSLPYFSVRLHILVKMLSMNHNPPQTRPKHRTPNVVRASDDAMQDHQANVQTNFRYRARIMSFKFL